MIIPITRRVVSEAVPAMAARPAVISYSLELSADQACKLHRVLGVQTRQNSADTIAIYQALDRVLGS
jgi:hypothetical protein